MWEEFLQCNRLAPIAVAVAGPPRTGKSDLAAMVAKKYVQLYALMFPRILLK